MNYAAEIAKYEKYLADQDAYLAALEAVEITERVTTAENTKSHPNQFICEMCHRSCRFEDHGKCRRCRAKLERQAALKKDRDALLRFRMKSTGAKEVDDAIKRHIGNFN